MNHTRVGFTILATAAAIASSACGSDQAASPSVTSQPTTSPSMAVSVGPAPPQNSTGRAPVSYDPCLDLPDAVVTQLGMDPRTRKRSDPAVFKDYTYLGCEFKEPADGSGVRGWILTISATNLTFEELRAKSESTTDLRVTGRDAFLYEMAGFSAAGRCTMAVDSTVGTLDLQLQLNPQSRDTQQPCDRLQQIAGTLQAGLPSQ